MKIIDWLKEGWRYYRGQTVGAIMLLIGYVVFLCPMIPKREFILMPLLITIGLFDIALIYVWKEITISQRLYTLFHQPYDTAIELISVVLVWWLLGDMVVIAYVFGLLSNHFAHQPGD